jgi:hypothetical protein
MRSSDIGGVDHKIPQTLVLSSPLMLRTHSLHDNAIFLIVVSQKRMPLEIEDRADIISFEFLNIMEEKELEGDIV